MSIFPIETRELRSFRLKYRIENLRFLIENKNSSVSFCITTSLSPKEREILRTDLNTLNFKVISISKNIIKFLFHATTWKNIYNLLEGQIFLVINKNKDFILTKKDIFSLINLNNFSLRLFLYNNQIYRKENLKLLLKNNLLENTNPKLIIYGFLIQIMLNLQLALTLRKNNLNLNV